jgi:hypothetical protein
MKIKLFLILALGFLILTPPVLAQTTRPSPRNQGVRADVRATMEAKREENRNKITAIRRERIRSFFGKMVVRVEATIERLEKLIERLETRIASIKKTDEKLDTSKAESTIKEARITIEKAKLELTALKARLEELLASDDPKLVFGQIQDSLKTIKDYLKETHVLLVQTIGEIRGLRVGDTNEE